MKKISFNHGTLGFDQNRAHFELPRSQVYLDSVEEIKRIHELKQIGFPCELNLNEKQLEMSFQIEQGFVPFLLLRQKDIHHKLNAAEYLVKLGYFFSNQQEFITIFDPLNFFVNDSGVIKILYRGIKGLMPAEGYENESVLDQIKRMLLILFTSARFDELRIHGLSFAKTKTKAGEKRMVLQILKAENFRDLLGALQQERQRREKQKHQDQNDANNLPEKKGFWHIWLHRFSSLDIKKQLLIGLGVWVLSLGVVFWLGRNTAPEPAPTLEVPNEFLEGLRQASLQEYDEASKAFQKVNFQKLSKTDQRIVLLSYLFSGQAQTALRLDPTFGEEVASYYGIVNKPKELLNIKSNHPAIQFEQAYAKKDYKKVIQLQSKVALDKRRRKAVVTAYLEQGQRQQAENFAKKLKDPELTKMIQEYK